MRFAPSDLAHKAFAPRKFTNVDTFELLRKVALLFHSKTLQLIRLACLSMRGEAGDELEIVLISRRWLSMSWRSSMLPALAAKCRGQG
jgi:hypothetical protein